MTGVLFACLAGMFLGGLNITMRRGLARVGDFDAGSTVIATLAAAIFLGRSELVGPRLIVVALLVVAGGTLVGATR